MAICEYHSRNTHVVIGLLDMTVLQIHHPSLCGKGLMYKMPRAWAVIQKLSRQARNQGTRSRALSSKPQNEQEERQSERRMRT